jgi:predicted transcriptional regulator
MKLTVIIDEELNKKLEEKAKELRISKSAFVRLAIIRAIEEEEKGKKRKSK